MTTVYKYIEKALMVMAVIMLGSCSAMTEDLPECDTQVKISFKYDYNIQRADMFHDHVGMVRLFVIDAETDKVVRDITVSNRDNDNVIKNKDNRYFTITLRDLPVDHKYRFMAVALQRPYDETMAHQEDKFVGTFPEIGENADKLQMRLTRSDVADTQGRYPVTAPVCGLDTLWMGHTTEPVTLPKKDYEHVIVCDTISMIRDTNYLNISLNQLQDPTDIKHEDFYIEIVDNNGFIAWNNDLIADKTLLYTPHAQWTMEQIATDGTVVRRSANYQISFSRLMIYATGDPRNATLSVFKKETDEKIIDIPLAYNLAKARKMFELVNYSEQEFLDREYDYTMDFWLEQNKWKYVNIKINTMPWVLRVDRIGNIY